MGKESDEEASLSASFHLFFFISKLTSTRGRPCSRGARGGNNPPRQIKLSFFYEKIYKKDKQNFPCAMLASSSNQRHMFTSSPLLRNRENHKKKNLGPAGGGCDESPMLYFFPACFLMKHLIKWRKEKESGIAVALAPLLILSLSSQPRGRVRLWCARASLNLTTLLLRARVLCGPNQSVPNR